MNEKNEDLIAEKCADFAITFLNSAQITKYILATDLMNSLEKNRISIFLYQGSRSKVNEQS